MSQPWEGTLIEVPTMRRFAGAEDEEEVVYGDAPHQGIEKGAEMASTTQHVEWTISGSG